MTYLLMKPSEPALKATDSFWKQQSSSAASAGASNLSTELPTSYNRRLCTKSRFLWMKKVKSATNTTLVEPKSRVPLTESQEEMRRLSDCGANRILEMASWMGFSNFKGAPLILGFWSSRWNSMHQSRVRAWNWSENRLMTNWDFQKP